MLDDDFNEPYETNLDVLESIGRKALKKLRDIEAKAQTCSFCGNTKHKEIRFIQSETGATICNECVAICNQLLNEQDQS